MNRPGFKFRSMQTFNLIYTEHPNSPAERKFMTGEYNGSDAILTRNIKDACSYATIEVAERIAANLMWATAGVFDENGKQLPKLAAEKPEPRRWADNLEKNTAEALFRSSCIDYINAVDECRKDPANGHEAEKQHVFEAALELVYGPKVWAWLKKNG